MSDYKVALVIGFLTCWLVLSSIGSAFKEISNCGKTYPIDYILYNNLFCEIKE